MPKKPLKLYKALSIAEATEKDAIYCIKANNQSEFTMVVTDMNGQVVPLKDLTSSVQSLVNDDGTIQVEGLLNKTIRINPSLVSTINSALQSGDPVSSLLNDAGYLTVADLPVTFPPSEHTHPISDIVNLQTELDNKLNVSNPSTTGTLTLQTDPSVLVGTFDILVRNPSTGSVAKVPETTYRKTGIDIPLNEVTGLQTALNGKMDKSVYDTTNSGIVDGAEGVVRLVFAQEAIVKGDPVYVSTTGDPTFVLRARADNSAKMPAFGIAQENIASGATGKVTVNGSIRGLNTGSFTLGKNLYVGLTGGLTSTKPTTNAQPIGIVLRTGGSDGVIAVEPQAIIEVDQTIIDGSTNPVAGNAVNDALALKQDLLTNPVTGTGTTGQVSFWNGTGTQTGDSNFIWDNSLKKAGIGVASVPSSVDILKIGDKTNSDAKNIVAISKDYNIAPLSNNGLNIEIKGVGQADHADRAVRAMKAVAFLDPNGYNFTDIGGSALGVEGVARIVGNGSVDIATGGYFRVLMDLNSATSILNTAVGVGVLQHTGALLSPIKYAVGGIFSEQGLTTRSINSANLVLGSNQFTLKMEGVFSGKWNIFAPSTFNNYFKSKILIDTTTDNGTDKLQVNGSSISTAWKVTGGLATQYQTGTGSLVDFNTGVRGATLTGFASNVGTVTATDNVLQAINKLDGNILARNRRKDVTYFAANDIAQNTVLVGNFVCLLTKAYKIVEVSVVFGEQSMNINKTIPFEIKTIDTDSAAPTATLQYTANVSAVVGAIQNKMYTFTPNITLPVNKLLTVNTGAFTASTQILKNCLVTVTLEEI